MDNQSLIEITGTGALAALVIAGVLASTRRKKRRDTAMVQRWAERNGLKLLYVRERAFREPGPFPLWGSNRQPNYFLRVQDGDGRERSGWVRLGTLLSGTSGSGEDQVEVEWDKH